MAWIESHQELAGHPKTKKLARLLGVSLPTAIGHLHMLWWWAMDYAESGCISKFESEDIADAVSWPPEDAQRFVDSLVESKFVMQTDSGLCINDWHDYTGRFLDQKEKNRDRKRKSREKAKEKQSGHADVTGTSQGNESDDQGSHGATEPDLTEPDLTRPNQTKPKDKPPVSPKGEPPSPETVPEKMKIADYVYMVPGEYEKLLEKMDEAERDRLVLEFAAWISGQSKRVQKERSAYLTILTWHRRDAKRQQSSNRGTAGSGRRGNQKTPLKTVTNAPGKTLTPEEFDEMWRRAERMDGSL